MWYSVSDTAEYGGYVTGPRMVTEETRKEMKEVLKEIQNGSFAETWIDENVTGLKQFLTMRRKERGLQIEEVGARLREMMPFLKPKRLKDYDPNA
jgi:ketol-acid reductoisomerase